MKKVATTVQPVWVLSRTSSYSGGTCSALLRTVVGAVARYDYVTLLRPPRSSCALVLTTHCLLLRRSRQLLLLLLTNGHCALGCCRYARTAASSYRIVCLFENQIGLYQLS